MVTNEIVVAVDEAGQRILIRDQPELQGAVIYSVVKLLLEISLDERSKPGLPKRYKSLVAKVIADQLDLPTDEAARSAIKRARDLLKEAANGLGLPFDANALIETTTNGYRLNPLVTVVKPDQILSG